LFVKFGARIRRGQTHLETEHIQLLRETNRLLNGFLCLDRQAEDERAVDDNAGLMAVLGEPAHFVRGDAFLDARERFVIPAFVADEEQAQSVVLEALDRVLIEIGAAVTAPVYAERPKFLGDFTRARKVGGKGVVIEEK